jgi:antitoxin YefM
LSMNRMTVSEAGGKLNQLLDEASDTHRPVLITGPRSNAVLVGEADWKAIQESIYLLSIPGMRESIREGFDEPVSACDKHPGW